MSKNLFTRVVPAVAVVSALSFTMLAGCSMTDSTNADSSGAVVDEVIVDETTGTGNDDTAKVMTEDEAKAIVFEDAGVVTSDATNVKVEKKTEDGIAVYEIEFDAKGVNYDYVIDAKTGVLIEYSEEAVVEIPANGSSSSSSNSSNSGSSGSSGSSSSGSNASGSSSSTK